MSKKNVKEEGRWKRPNGGSPSQIYFTEWVFVTYFATIKYIFQHLVYYQIIFTIVLLLSLEYLETVFNSFSLTLKD